MVTVGGVASSAFSRSLEYSYCFIHQGAIVSNLNLSFEADGNMVIKAESGAISVNFIVRVCSKYAFFHLNCLEPITKDKTPFEEHY